MWYASRQYGAALQKIVALPVILNVIYRSVEFPYNFSITWASQGATERILANTEKEGLADFE